MMSRTILPCGSEWSAWIGNEFVGVYETAKDAADALYNWDKKLYQWKSLWDVEQEMKS